MNHMICQDYGLFNKEREALSELGFTEGFKKESTENELTASNRNIKPRDLVHPVFILEGSPNSLRWIRHLLLLVLRSNKILISPPHRGLDDFD